MNAAPKSGILRRAAANAGMLLSGKAAAGVMQLATFALAARGLGVHEFGWFSVLVAQVMLLTGLAAFDSNQAVIRYGVDHLAAGNPAGYQALVKAGTLLDFGAATVAMIAAIILAPLLAGWLGWDARIVMLGQLIAPLAYANAIATPKGMLRLFGRYDLLTAHAVVTPGARLVGVSIAWALGAGLAAYLLIWLAAGLIGAVVAMFFAWREAHRRDLLGGIDASLRGLSRENQGVWLFTLFSNLTYSVALIPTQLSTVIIGAALGPAPAALFRVAREIGTGLMKPVDLVNQALFPDLARLVAARDWARLKRAAVRAGLVASGIGLVVVVIVLAIGGKLLGAVFGHEYAAAAPVLAMLAIATTIRVLALAADPVMYALGRPNVPLIVAVAANLLFLAVLAWRLPIDGVDAAGWAFIALGLSAAALSGIWAWRAIGERARAG